MSNERKLIRDAIRDCLSAVGDIPIFTGRDIDGRELEEFINVFISDGESSYEGLQSKTEASVTISYRNVAELTDDELDEMADPFKDAIETTDFGSIMQGIIYSGFEYLDERERGFDGINLRFVVVY